MKILHLLTSGNTGGIEVLCQNIAIESDWENTFVFFHGEGKIYDEMMKKGYNVIDIGNKNFFNKVLYIIKLSKDYDILVSHNEDFFVRAVQNFASIFSRTKSVCFIHSCFYIESFYPTSLIKRILCKIIYQLNFILVDKIVSVANAGFVSYSKYFYINKNKRIILYNGIARNIIEAGFNHKLRKHLNRYNILYIGRLSFHKRVDLLIDAVSILVNNYDLHLTIVGDGAELSELQKKVKDKNLNEVINFEGEKTNIKDFLASSDIFVYPSEQEIFGISIVEAMAYGLPCIANQVGGIPEIIENHKNGFLTRSVSSISISESIEEVIKLYQNNCIDNISCNSKNTANKFSMRNNLINMKKIFKSL